MHIATDYLHALNGRLRVKVPEVKGSSVQARAVQEHLENLYGVKSVHANPITGNVLVHYHPEHISQNEILKALRDDLGCFSPAATVQMSRSSQGDGLAGTVARAFMESALQTMVMAII